MQTSSLQGRLRRLLLSSAALLFTALGGPSQAAGLLTPVGSSESLVLEAQHVEVVVESGLALTRVEQRFSNPHSRDLEATYQFPLPAGAAVGEFTYWIDGQPVQAEVLKKQQASALHEAQKSAGRETALLEQGEHQGFRMSVSPVRAGADVRVRLVYLQQTEVDHAIGRYVYPLQDGGTDELTAAFWQRDEAVADAFSFRMRIRSGYPVDAVRVPNGQATVTDLGNGEWQVEIDATHGSGASTGPGLDDAALHAADEADRVIDAARPASSAAWQLDRDVVVYWRLADNLPGAVDLVTYREPGANEGSFLLTLTPGIDLAPITEGRDWLFVLDTSGSMAGKFAALADGVGRTLQSLRTGDRFRIVTFSDRARALSRDYIDVNQASVTQALQDVRALKAGGSTNLFDGLHKALKGVDATRTSAVVLVTDGVTNVGPKKMSRFLALLEPYDVRLFTAVMGNNANHPLLEGLTRHVAGFAVQVSNDDDLAGLVIQAVSRVSHEALHDLDIDIDGVDVFDVHPARYRRVYRGEQLVLSGRYRGAGQAQLTIQADVSGERKRYRSELAFPVEDARFPELERLAAFAQIRALQHDQALIGDTDDTREAITDIAMQHGLVTDYTSLVVVREEVFAEQGIDRGNARRVAREQAAQAARASKPAALTRQDTAAPAFPSNRATGSNGGGSLGAVLLVLLGVLAAVRIWLSIKDRIGRS